MLRKDGPSIIKLLGRPGLSSVEHLLLNGLDSIDDDVLEALSIVLADGSLVRLLTELSDNMILSFNFFVQDRFNRPRSKAKGPPILAFYTIFL